MPVRTRECRKKKKERRGWLKKCFAHTPYRRIRAKTAGSAAHLFGVCWPLFVLKTAQDARQFFVWCFLAPFRCQIHLLVLGAVVAHVLRRRGWLKKCFAHAAAYSISTLKTAQDALQILFWPCFGLLPTAWLIFTPHGSTGLSPIFILTPFRSSADRMAHFYP